MKAFTRYFSFSFFVCILLYLVISLVTKEFKTGILLWQIVSSLAFISSVYYAQNLSKKALFLYIFIYQIILSFTLHSIFLIDAENLFGYIAVDSKFYSQCALILKNKSFIDALRFLDGRNYDLSDYGFPMFLRWIYSIGQDAYYSMKILIVINSILQTLVSMLMYSIGKKILEDEEKVRMAVILWSFNTANIFLNVSGLKEPLFLYLCMSVIYTIYKIAEKQSLLLWHMIFLSLIVSTWLFRYYMSLFFIIIYIGYILFSYLYKKYFVVVCMVSLITCIFFTSVLIKYFPEIYYSQLKTDELYKHSSILFQMNSYVLAFLSPIPKFFQLNTPQNLITVVYSIEKFYLSVWGIAGTYYIIKEKRSDFYPLISIVLFTLLMMVVSSHMIDYRYPYVIMPCFFLLIAAGIDHVSMRVSSLYFCYATLICILFNLRLY